MCFTTLFFVEKMREAFALQKLFTVFQQNSICIFQILTFVILTKRQLMTSLVLKKRTKKWVIEMLCYMAKK